jgi:muramidase (phage lysozyme)
LLKTRKALDSISSGDIETAIQKLIEEWPSLPGGKQSKMNMKEARKLFDQFLGDN